MSKSKIGWTDVTWNPLAGCTRASEGCDMCYAAKMSLRLEAMALADIAAGKDPGGKAKYIGIAVKNKRGVPAFNGTINLDEDELQRPYSWKKPRMVFVNSMSDLFHDDVPEWFILSAFNVMRDNPQHIFQVLTKRPGRASDFTKRLPSVPSNVWIGTSVENQEQADIRIPELLKIPAGIRFLSCEPLLGPVDLSFFLDYHPGTEAKPDGKRGNITLFGEKRDLEDRQSGPDMETIPKRVGETGAQASEWIPSGQKDDKREKDSHGGAQAGSSTLSRRDTGGDANQSQEWDQRRQSSPKSGGRYGFGEHEACIQNGPKGTERGEEPVSEAERSGYRNDSESLRHGGCNADGVGGRVQRVISSNFQNCTGGTSKNAAGENGRLHKSAAARQEEKKQKGPIHLVICGGESGPKARRFDLTWAYHMKDQCQEVGVPFFMKQVGSNPTSVPAGTRITHKKGEDMNEWPLGLRVQQFPDSVIEVDDEGLW